jgi:hypothetical protein
VRLKLKRLARVAEKLTVAREAFTPSHEDQVAAFVAACEDRLTPEEGAAMLLAIAEQKGVSWSTPPRNLVWNALHSLCKIYLRSTDLQRYQAAVDARLARGRPVVDPGLVSKVKFKPAPRRWKRPIQPHRLARDTDEFLDQQRQQASDLARRQHVRNQRTQRYAALRSEALSAAGHRCERCGAQTPLQLHHRHYATLGRESLRDIEMLCDPCHLRETERQRALRRGRWKPWGSGRIKMSS